MAKIGDVLNDLLGEGQMARVAREMSDGVGQRFLEDLERGSVMANLTAPATDVPSYPIDEDAFVDLHERQEEQHRNIAATAATLQAMLGAMVRAEKRDRVHRWIITGVSSATLIVAVLTFLKP
jgi:hypothetical protein